MRSRLLRPSMAILALIVAGCAESHQSNMTTDPVTGRASAPGVAAPSAPVSGRAVASRKIASYMAPSDAGAEKRDNVPILDPIPGELSAAQGGKPPDPTPRKILYTADIDLVVDDFPKLETAILKLVKQTDGYLADTDISGSTGSNRTARWKIRIPIDKFDSFLESAATLGELTRRQVHSQDVTEEFYDLEARIKNKKVEETRLLKHLQDSTGKLDEILAAERELSRVREEVERQEGRMRMLANLAALTTVTITAQERTNYVPATAPGFSTRVSRQFDDSIKSLVDTSEGLTVWAAGVVPWLPVYIILAIVMYMIYRRVRRRVIAQMHRPRPAAT